MYCRRAYGSIATVHINRAQRALDHKDRRWKVKASVSVLGTGRMGSALSRALLHAGHRTTAWNRTPEKAAPLATLGAQLAEGVRVVSIPL